MKESRISIIVLSIISIMSIIVLVFSCIFNFNNEIASSILIGVLSGCLVGLTTSICSYFSHRKTIINNIYSFYFNIYTAYYYSCNLSVFGWYNSRHVFKSISENNPKITAELSNYHGFFKRKDKLYKVLEPEIKLECNYKARVLSKSLLYIINKKYFFQTFQPYINEVENILISINSIKFIKDRNQMISLFKYSFKEDK